ncbi:MAG TPA: hypothetical protein VGK88_08575 [bacterium]|jgi:hypothetical protein
MRFLIIAALLWIASATPAMGASAPAGQPVRPGRVEVGLYLLNLGGLDTGTGTYTMDLYLSFHCDRPCDPSHFEIMNGRVTHSVAVDNKSQQKVFRIQAALVAPINLRDYPFDSHKLSFIIEDGNVAARGALGQTIDEQIYLVDPTRTAVSPLVQVTGWTVDPHWRAATSDNVYPTFKEIYSRYEFSLRIVRPLLTAVLKVLLPAIFLVIVGLLGLLLAPDKVTQRLTVGTSALVGSVLLHLNLTSTIPPVGYLTFADKFMLINYVPLVLAVAATVWMLWLTDRKQDARAHRVHIISGVVIPVVWIALQGVNLLTL